MTKDLIPASPPTDHGLGKGARRLSWVLQLAAAAILGQTLFFKFAGAAESVALFETLGAEPYGRIGLGVVELVAVVFLLRERTALLGALLALGLMAGALASHLAVLGIEVGGDGGALFALALVTFLCAAAISWLRRRELPLPVKRLLGPAGRRILRPRLHRRAGIPD